MSSQYATAEASELSKASTWTHGTNFFSTSSVCTQQECRDEPSGATVKPSITGDTRSANYVLHILLGCPTYCYNMQNPVL
ncbi:hypothetical protein QCA50_005540 [Cerrena zonata]|uniref:Uncharacterized protein n=1 Tax=Cerrena zonata TaxID=2478898 RepID=A0AAW0GDD8_9APHY